MIYRSPYRWCAFLFLLVVSRSTLTQSKAAEPIIGPFQPKILAAGVYDYDHTLIIPNQRVLTRVHDKTGVGVPAPYLGTQASQPGGSLRGEDEFGTVLRFAPTVRGCLIKTQGYGEGNVGAYWNNGNTQGDQALRSNWCSRASDFTVDGRAEIRAYPQTYNEWNPQPDPHGPDSAVRADGLCSEGTGFTARRLRFFQIPGTAMVVKGGQGTQAGAYGIYDGAVTELSDIFVAAAINGIDVSVGDSKLSHIYVTGVVKDGLVIRGSGTILAGDHVWGATGAAVFTAAVMASQCYHEAARIGTHIMPGADTTRIDGLNIGPATCWERGVKIEASGCSVDGLEGMVRLNSPERPDSAGVEIAPGLVHTTIGGSLVIAADAKNPEAKADGLILRGHRSKVDLKGGWNSPTQATFVRVAEGITGSTVEIRGSGEGGTALDLSASGLDRINGLGNEFKLKWSGSAARVIYPGGGTRYNLAPGTQVWVDGVLQSAQSRRIPSVK